MRIDPIQWSKSAPLFDVIKPITDELQQEEADATEAAGTLTTAQRSTSAVTVQAMTGAAAKAATSPLAHSSSPMSPARSFLSPHSLPSYAQRV